MKILPYKGILPKIHESVFICEGAIVVGDVELAENVSVWFNTVIRGDVNYIRVGKNTNLQDNSTLHVTYKKYPLIIGDNVTLGHNAVVHGCTIHNNVLIGMNATILDRAVVKSNSIVAAGSLVKEGFEVPEGVLVAGVPAKIVKELKEEDIEKIAQSAKNYVYYIGEYKDTNN